MQIMSAIENKGGANIQQHSTARKKETEDSRGEGEGEAAASMDEQEFRRVLSLFSIVRSRDYCVLDLRGANSEIKLVEGDKRETKAPGMDLEDPFWEKLKLAAEANVGAAESERFCKAFEQVHKKLVYEELSLDAARSFIDHDTTLE